MATDLKLALRRLRLRPAFALAIVAILTLCIGANTAVFSLLSNAIPSKAPPASTPSRHYAMINDL